MLREVVLATRNSNIAPSLEVTNDLSSADRAKRNQLTRAIKCKPKMVLITLSIGMLGLTTTVCEAKPSMQEQLETVQRQLVQQQRIIQEMQRQLDAQKTFNKQLQDEEQNAKQLATTAESTAQHTEKDVHTLAQIEGIDLSAETYQFGDSKGNHFLIPKTNTVMTISGFIRGSAIYDFNQIESPTKFATRHIVVNGEPAGQPDTRTTFTANASRFILGSTTPTGIGKLSTFFSWDFDGNTTSSSADPRLRQAWGQLDNVAFGGNLRVGQVWTSWDDLDALPETMDFQGPNASQQNRQPLIRWERDYNDEYTLWVALEQPNYSITDGNTEGSWPDTIVSLNWHGDWGHLKPALIGRNIRADNLDGSSDSAFGWGTQLAGTIKVPLLADKDNFKFQVVYGGGIGSYNNDGGFDDALFKANGDMQIIDSFQWYGAFQHWWTDKLRSNAVFGWVDVDNESEQSEDSLDRTLYAAGNLVWSPVKQVDMGIEYLWGERRNMNNESGSANRIQATVKYKF